MVDAVLHLQFVDALCLIETSPAGAQRRLRSHRVHCAQPRAQLFAIAGAVVGLSVDAQPALHRQAFVQIGTHIPESERLVAIRLRIQVALHALRRRAGKRRVGRKTHIARIVVLTPEPPPLDPETMSEQMCIERVLPAHSEHMKSSIVVDGRDARRLVDASSSLIREIGVRQNHTRVRCVRPFMIYGGPSIHIAILGADLLGVIGSYCFDRIARHEQLERRMREIGDCIVRHARMRPDNSARRNRSR